jgi:redox-sensitive bicupin YhaK (pirin superfamily)
MSARRIKQIYRSLPTIEGAGVRLYRAFGNSQTPEFDPFLLLDEFHSANPDDYLPGFPWHPHRGIETITYILEGLVEHGDSMGNAGTIGAGEVQWMTAGSGIIHQEMPQKTGSGAMRGFQVWANLPAAQKMMPPRYRGLREADIPMVELAAGGRAKVSSGVLETVQGPVHDIVTNPEFFDVTLPAGSTFTHDVKPGYTALAYVLAGQARFDDGHDGKSIEVADGLCGPKNVVLYGHQGDQVVVTSTNSPTRFLFLSGNPLGEPIAWHGPIVMNTDEELRLAFRELQDGSFIKRG